MNSSMLMNLVVLVVSISFAGCGHSRSCEITFKNKSNDMIWVDRLNGVRKDGGRDRCGYLIPEGIATIAQVYPIRRLPETAEITWWVVADINRPTEKTTLKSFVDLPKELPPNHALYFEYGETGMWKASVQKR
jgi:hypothetical protein